MAPSSGRFELESVPSLTAILLMQLITRGIAFSMLSRSQTHVINSGDNIDLDCEFYTKYFNLFDNPVLWIKTQYHEHSRINIMSNINSPFVDTGRFKVTFIPSPPRYRLVLGIERVSMEDSGNYTCEVRGPETSVLGVITHVLFVRASVRAVTLTINNCTDSCISRTPSYVIFTENQPSFLQCITTGGNPPPSVALYLDDIDITNKFEVETRTRLLGSEGLKIMHSSVYTKTTNLILAAEDDGKEIRCSASVPGLPENTSKTKVRVHYAPVITCTESEAYQNEHHAHVTCEVRARPRVSAIYWIIYENGTIVSDSNRVGEYWTLTQDWSDGVTETKLFMRRASLNCFRTYTVVADNIVGSTRANAALKQKMPKDSQMDDLPHYPEIWNRSSMGHMDYIIIPVGDSTERHLANCNTIALLIAFQILFCITS